MNKLREWFKRMATIDTRRIGFGAVSPKARPPTVGLLATLPSLDIDLARQALEAGAEGLVIPATLPVDAEALKALMDDCPKCLWGLQTIESEAPESIEGIDFLIVTVSSDISVLEPPDRGRLLIIDSAWDDMRLRAADQIAVDGVIFTLFPNPGERPTLEHLLNLKRLSMLTRKPLIAQFYGNLPPKEMGALRNGGLSGVIVPGDAENWLELIKELRQTIVDLPIRARPTRDVDAMLPAPPPPAAAEPEPGEEEEEEEEEDT